MKVLLFQTDRSPREEYVASEFEKSKSLAKSQVRIVFFIDGQR